MKKKKVLFDELTLLDVFAAIMDETSGLYKELISAKLEHKRNPTRENLLKLEKLRREYELVRRPNADRYTALMELYKFALSKQRKAEKE